MIAEPSDSALMTSRVRVRIVDGAGADRLYATRGVESAEGRAPNGLPYRAGALVPARPWRPASAVEQAALLVPSGRHPVGTTIEVLPAPPELVATFRAFDFAPGRTLAEHQTRIPEDAYRRALYDKLPLLEPLIESIDGLQLLGICVQNGGLWSTTTHVDGDGHETFSGLHVDNFDRRTHGERHLARRQVSINLGHCDRFFVFALPTVDELPPIPAGEPAYIGYTRALFSRAPQTSLYKVRVRPGEMYFAPTDNLIHDGTTVGGDRPDLTLNLRGYFRADAPSLDGKRRF